jgi:hypothetical protein
MNGTPGSDADGLFSAMLDVGRIVVAVQGTGAFLVG